MRIICQNCRKTLYICKHIAVVDPEFLMNIHRILYKHLINSESCMNFVKTSKYSRVLNESKQIVDSDYFVEYIDSDSEEFENFRVIQQLIEQEKAFCFNYREYKIVFEPVLQKDHHYTITIHDDLGEICSDPEINIESIIQQKESLNIEIL